MAEAVFTGANALLYVPALSPHPTLTLLSHIGDMHARTLHVSVKFLLSPVACDCRQRYKMPRKQGGIGRTGGKHKQPAKYNIHREEKGNGTLSGPLFSSVQEETTHAAENMAPNQSSVEELSQVLSGCAVDGTSEHALPEPPACVPDAPSAFTSPPESPPPTSAATPAPATAPAACAEVQLFLHLPKKEAMLGMREAMFCACEIEEAQAAIDRIDRGIDGPEP